MSKEEDKDEGRDLGSPVQMYSTSGGNQPLAHTEDKLKQALSRRRTPAELLGQGILLDHPARSAAMVTLKTRKLERLTQREKLKTFIAQRPSLAELATKKKGLIEDTMIWTRQVSKGSIPLPRNCHTMSLVGHSMFLIGGYGTGGTTIDLLALDVTSGVWTRPAVGGMIPVERYSHTCSVVGTKLVLFGGFSFNGFRLADLFILDTEFRQPYQVGDYPSQTMLLWYQPTITGSGPSPRAAHTSTVIGSLVYIFGGNDGQQLFNDLYVLDTELMIWNRPEQFGQIPSPRAGHTATVVNRTHIFVFGGGNSNGPCNDVYILNTETMTWTAPAVYGTIPSPRLGHTMTPVFDTQLILFGGGYLDKAFDDLHMFDLDTFTWARPVGSGTAPIPRAGHSSCAFGTQLYIFGGGDADDVFNDLHILDTTFLRVEKEQKRKQSLKKQQQRQREEMMLNGSQEGDGQERDQDSHEVGSEPHSPTYSSGIPPPPPTISISAPRYDYPTEANIEGLDEKGGSSFDRMKLATERVRMMLEGLEGSIEEQLKEEQKRTDAQIVALQKVIIESQKTQISRFREELQAVTDFVCAELKDMRESIQHAKWKAKNKPHKPSDEPKFGSPGLSQRASALHSPSRASQSRLSGFPSTGPRRTASTNLQQLQPHQSSGTDKLSAAQPSKNHDIPDIPRVGSSGSISQMGGPSNNSDIESGFSSEQTSRKSSAGTLQPFSPSPIMSSTAPSVTIQGSSHTRDSRRSELSKVVEAPSHTPSPSPLASGGQGHGQEQLADAKPPLKSEAEQAGKALHASPISTFFSTQGANPGHLTLNQDTHSLSAPSVSTSSSSSSASSSSLSTSSSLAAPISSTSPESRVRSNVAALTSLINNNQATQPQLVSPSTPMRTQFSFKSGGSGIGGPVSPTAMQILQQTSGGSPGLSTSSTGGGGSTGSGDSTGNVGVRNTGVVAARISSLTSSPSLSTSNSSTNLNHNNSGPAVSVHSRVSSWPPVPPTLPSTSSSSSSVRTAPLFVAQVELDEEAPVFASTGGGSPLMSTGRGHERTDSTGSPKKGRTEQKTKKTNKSR